MSLIDIALNIQTVCKVLFFPAAILSNIYPYYLSLYICLGAILRKNKIPKFNSQYLQQSLITRQLLQNQYIFCLIYLVMIMFVPHFSNFVQLIPLAIIYVVGLADFIFIKNIDFGLKSYAIAIRSKRTEIYRAKAKLELLYFLPIIFMIAFGGLSLLLYFLIYGQFIMFKYKLNQHTQWAAYQIHQVVYSKTRIIRPLAYIYDKFTSLCYYLASK